MIRGDDSKIIEVVHSVCCGLDIHKESISACLIFLMIRDESVSRFRRSGH